ncbi:MAG: hypothetical protein H7Y18_13435 [Clostridiaceae bacterium]|nr:hypothetical protein [Clostridiaceae bacterium]
MNEQMLFTNRLRFREWLINNHINYNGIWLIFAKSEILKTLQPDKALQEALCSVELKDKSSANFENARNDR